MLKSIKFSRQNKRPLYLQIVDSFNFNVSKGYIKMDDKLPSINVFSKECGISRDTVEKAYKELKHRDVIVSKRGKGFYVNKTTLISKINVLFLINKLSPYKLKIYDAFIESIGNEYHTDFEIYHCDESLFLSLMEKNKNSYDYYVIMPHFKSGNLKQSILRKQSLKAIDAIPKDKLIIMDNSDLKIEGNIIEIFQDFENDIYDALKLGVKKVNKYNRLSLLTSNDISFPYLQKIKTGFTEFCKEQKKEYRIINHKVVKEDVKEGDLFIIITDEDLIQFLDLVTNKNFTVGKDVGVISYNETPFKRLLDIAVISTDFEEMGRRSAQMISQDRKAKVKNPFHLIDRKSF